MKQRNPIDNAFYAFVALSAEDKLAMVQRFNAWQANAARPEKLEWTPRKYE